MKNIALELQPCVKQRSGIGVYTYEIAKRLKNDDELNYYGTIFNFLGKTDIANDLKEVPFKILINKLMPYGVYRRIWSFIPLSYNRIFNKNSEVYHFFNFIVPPNIKGTVITTIHDMAYKKFPGTLDPKNLKRLEKSIDYSVQRSNYIITISESSKKDILEEFDIPESKILIVSPSYSIKPSNLNIEDINCKYDINSSYILYVGNLEPRKNIPRLIEAFAELKKLPSFNHKLVIAGGKGWMYNEIFEIIDKLNISSDIVFTGFVSDSEKTALYKYADLFVFPSLYEGFGIPILESMAMGTPVVCSDSSSMPEAGGDAAFYVDPLDVESIANGIKTVISDNDLRQSMINKGYEQIKKFSWDESVRKLKELYKSL